MSLAIKRVFDFSLALAGLLVLAPLFAAIAVAIRLSSPGPVFYKATRVGKGGRLFGMYKFRTMADLAGPRVTARDDPRITPIGRLLRATKLNELPQLFNVLKGEMSLVGPRPEDPEFVAHYTPEEREVLSVVPGITSPAAVIYYDEEALLEFQNAARSYLSDIMPTKLRLELLYVRHRSLLLDLDVLARTALATVPVFRRAAPDIEEILLGPIQRVFRRYLPWFAQDFVTAFVAVALAGLLWRANMVLDVGLWPSVFAALALAFVFSAVNLLLGVQRTAWDYAGLQDALEVVLSSVLATAVIVAARLLTGLPPFPPAMLVVVGLLALLGFVMTRYRKRVAGALGYRWAQLRGTFSGRERVLVLGGGEAGRLLVWHLQNSVRGQAFDVSGIVDDDLYMRGVRIHNVRVLGGRKQIPQLVAQQAISLIVFAIHNISAEEQEAILAICRQTPARVVVVPDVLALLGALDEGRSGERAAGRAGADAAGPAPAPATAAIAAAGPALERARVAAWLAELDGLLAAGETARAAQRLAELQRELAGARADPPGETRPAETRPAPGSPAPRAAGDDEAIEPTWTGTTAPSS
jgi:lipopolysaccharide/colanic/teichoic acid biosynthesis glycosyltransferase